MSLMETFDAQKRREGRRQVVGSAFMLAILGTVAVGLLSSSASTPSAAPSDPRITQHDLNDLVRQSEKQADAISDLTDLFTYCQTANWNTAPCMVQQSGSGGGPTLVTRYDTTNDDSDDSDDGGTTVVVRQQPTTTPKTSAPRSNPPKADKPDPVLPDVPDPGDVAKQVTDVAEQVTGKELPTGKK